MKKYFNTEGLCRPKKHYMVNLEDRLDQIKTILIDREKYFVINRGRQYGKTTTLAALEDYLQEEYIVIWTIIIRKKDICSIPSSMYRQYGSRYQNGLRSIMKNWCLKR